MFGVKNYFHLLLLFRHENDKINMYFFWKDEITGWDSKIMQFLEAKKSLLQNV